MNTKRTLGLWISDGLGQAFPELRDQLGRLYGDRVARLGFVPREWLAEARALQASRPNDLVRIAPAKIGPLRNPDAPVFVTSDAEADAWQAVFDATNKAVGEYAAKRLAEGRAELDRLYGNAVFWNRAYAITKAIADAPATIVGAAADGAQSVVGGVLRKLFGSWLVWVAVLGVGGFIAWKAGALKLKRKR